MKIFIKYVLCTLLWLTGALLLTGTESAEAQEGVSQKAVLVTGASSGIGRKVTELLAERGYFVYAGARSEEDLAELDLIENVRSVRLDVTIIDDIEAAVETVRDGGKGLYGVVNNAGVAVVGPMIEMDEDDLDFLFDVNIYGPYRITKAFVPFLLEEGGRITTIGSLSGIRTRPFVGAYSMSKHAVEAFTDALVLELGPLGVRASVIEPGNYQSQITNAVRNRMATRNQTAEGSLYENQMKQFFNSPSDRSQYKAPDDVAEAVFHALFSDEPKTRYLVTPNEEEAEVAIRTTIQELVQLNQDHQYSYDRDALIVMLDEALGKLD